MTAKPHPTDALEKPKPHKITDSKGKKILQFDDLQLRAERIKAYNLGRESMREEAAKICKVISQGDWDFDTAQNCSNGIRSIKL